MILKSRNDLQCYFIPILIQCMRKVKILKKYLETLLDPNYSFFLLTMRNQSNQESKNCFEHNRHHNLKFYMTSHFLNILDIQFQIVFLSR